MSRRFQICVCLVAAAWLVGAAVLTAYDAARGRPE
jgi:hypothetical protein